MPICKTCKVERSSEYFYSSLVNRKKTNDIKIYYITNKCKICSGVKVRDKFRFVPERVKGDYDKRKQYLLLLRLEINKGQATDRDIINLINCYSEIYGDSVPIFRKIVDEYVFMWEKLKEFAAEPTKEIKVSKLRPMERINKKDQ